MSRPENTVFLIGRLTADPELKTTSSGIEFCNFTIAVDRNNKNGEEKQTDFIRCTAWRQTAAFIVKYLSKGRKIVVMGEIQTRNYEDKNGEKRSAFEVVCYGVTFADGKTENAHRYQPAEAIDPIDSVDDDLPF